MKVVHVVTTTSGGAGIAAVRIHEALRAEGHDSAILALRHPSPSPDDGVVVFPTRFTRIWERVAKRAGFPIRQSDKAEARLNKLDIHGISFSEPATDYDIASHPMVREADVVHLHWVGGFLDWQSFFTRVERPVVWTLHDQNPFQGGFHLASDVELWGKAVRDREREITDRKAEILRHFEGLHVVAPSEWTKARSMDSATLGRFPHSCIRNPIDATKWQPFDRVHARRVFDLPADAKVLLTVAERAAWTWKGADILNGALSQSALSTRYLWAAVGDEAGLTGVARPLGVLNDRRMMALAYSAADLFIHPSREDNLPNVLLESLVIGTPVVGHPVGGVPEIIDDGVNGTIAAAVDSSALAAAILRADGIEFDRRAIRDNASVAYDPTRIAKEYLTVYDTLIS